MKNSFNFIVLVSNYIISVRLYCCNINFLQNTDLFISNLQEKHIGHYWSFYRPKSCPLYQFAPKSAPKMNSFAQPLPFRNSPICDFLPHNDNSRKFLQPNFLFLSNFLCESKITIVKFVIPHVKCFIISNIDGIAIFIYFTTNKIMRNPYFQLTLRNSKII